MSEYLNALAPGREINEYEIVRVLGAGAFGITYLAVDRRRKFEVAIKEYLPNDFAAREHARNGRVVPKSENERADFKWGLGRFLDESRLLARFGHPNIVRVYQSFRARGTGYLVMEYVNGDTFTELLRRRGTLTESELKVLLFPILDGLEEVHRAEFLHRDIKPSNILVRNDGSPVILDFGSARQALSARSRSVTSLVTPSYAPIEQYSSRGNQGPWTDIYALGALAYRAVTGKPPKPAPERAYENDFEVWREGIPDITPSFAKAIELALAFKESDRPQSIAEFRAALGEDDDAQFRGSGPPNHKRTQDDEPMVAALRKVLDVFRRPRIRKLPWQSIQRIARARWRGTSLWHVGLVGVVLTIIGFTLIQLIERPERGLEGIIGRAPAENLPPESEPNILLPGTDRRSVHGKSCDENDHYRSLADTEASTPLVTALTVELMGSLEGHQDDVEAVAFSPDGELIATASADGTARVWDVATRRQSSVLMGHGGQVNSVAFLPDGTHIATASDDGTARIWQVQSGRQTNVLAGHDGPVNSVAISPDGSLILTASADATIRLWRIVDGQQANVADHASGVSSASFSPDGSLIATSSYRTVSLWDASFDSPPDLFRGASRRHYSVVFSPLSSSVLLSFVDQEATVLDIRRDNSFVSLGRHTSQVRSGAFSPNGLIVATAEFNGTLRLWEVSTGRQLTSRTAHNVFLTAVAFSMDGLHLATASGDNTARIWRIGY